jgi:ubiquinone/menaquinone biosynthesis C-methylase UbiE
MRSWIDFWNAEHSIYVNDRHKRLHAEGIARDIAIHVPAQQAIVLDHGCGEALYAEEVARVCGRLILCEAAPRILTDLSARLAGRTNIEVIDPAGAAAIPAESLDLVVVNSVLQYLSRDELAALLELWRRVVKPTGRLVIADVIPPRVSPMRDAGALLSFAARGGFLLPAIGGLVRTAFSDYARIRKTLGFSMYEESEVVGMLAAHGFACERVHPNFGHNQARMTFSARPV